MPKRKNIVDWDSALAIARKSLLNHPDIDTRDSAQGARESKSQTDPFVDGAEIHRGVQEIFVEGGGDLAREVVQAARVDRDAFDACMTAAESMRARGQPIPRYLQALIDKVEAGKRRRPLAKPGKHPRSNYWRDLAIATTVARLYDHGIHPTRNDASQVTPDSFSGCDIVQHALQEAGIFLGYEAVKKIWQPFSPKEDD